MQCYHSHISQEIFLPIKKVETIMTEILVSALNNMPMTTNTTIMIVIILLTGANGNLNE